MTPAPPQHKPSTMWRLGVLFPRPWQAELKAAAEANGVTMNDIVRMAVRRFLTGRLERDAA